MSQPIGQTLEEMEEIVKRRFGSHPKLALMLEFISNETWLTLIMTATVVYEGDLDAMIDDQQARANNQPHVLDLKEINVGQVREFVNKLREAGFKSELMEAANELVPVQ